MDAVRQVGLVRAEQKGRITSPDLLVTFVLMQHRKRLALGGCKCTVRAHVEPFISQHPQDPFLQPLIPKPIALHGLVVAKVQDPPLGLVDLSS